MNPTKPVPYIRPAICLTNDAARCSDRFSLRKSWKFNREPAERSPCPISSCFERLRVKKSKQRRVWLYTRAERRRRNANTSVTNSSFVCKSLCGHRSAPFSWYSRRIFAQPEKSSFRMEEKGFERQFSGHRKREIQRCVIK